MKPSEIKAKRVQTDKNTVRILLGGRATYAYLMEAQPDDLDNPNSVKSYKSGILFPKRCPAEVLAVVRQAIKDVVAIGVQKKWGGKKPVSLQLPLNDGDEKFKEDADKYVAYEGQYYMNAKKRENLGRPILKAYGKSVSEPGVIESGDWCVFDVNFYPYANRAKGVAVALNAITLIKQGERFSGGPSESSIDDEATGLYGESLGGMEEFDDVLDGLGEEEDLLAGL
jgi:hypothetical protein